MFVKRNKAEIKLNIRPKQTNIRNVALATNLHKIS